MTKLIYEPPTIEVIEVKIEKGFAASTPNFPINDWGNQNF